jgi:hypothetical protein
MVFVPLLPLKNTFPQNAAFSPVAGAGGPAGATPAAAGMPPAGGAGPSLVSGRGKDDDVTVNFGDPDPEDVKRYDLDIQDYAQEMDIEDIDYSELDA